MEKVKITKEQEEVFAKFKKHENELEAFLDKEWLESTFSPLKDFTSEQFAFMLCGWYEVEQPFKVGEWVMNSFNKQEYAQVYDVLDDCLRVKFVGKEDYVFEVEYRAVEKVTEQWKIKLLEAGRERPEFKVGDVVETENDIYIFQDYNEERVLAEVIKELEKGTVEFIHPVESRLKVKSND